MDRVESRFCLEELLVLRAAWENKLNFRAFTREIPWLASPEAHHIGSFKTDQQIERQLGPSVFLKPIHSSLGNGIIHAQRTDDMRGWFVKMNANPIESHRYPIERVTSNLLEFYCQYAQDRNYLVERSMNLQRIMFKNQEVVPEFRLHIDLSKSQNTPYQLCIP